MADEIQVDLYYGEYRHGIDRSHRIMVPVEWRENGAPTQFMVMPWPVVEESPECLIVLPLQRVAKVLATLSEYSLTKVNYTNLKRIVGASSKKVGLDRFGRLALSENLLRRAGIQVQGEAKLVGCIDHFELWNPERYQSAESELKQSAAEVSEEVFL